MGLGLLGFVLVQMLALAVALGGGAARLRHALANFGDVSDATEAQLIAALGPPRLLRRTNDADDHIDHRADFVAHWAETGSAGGWHIALAFVGDRCLGISHCNFQPLGHD